MVTNISPYLRDELGETLELMEVCQQCYYTNSMVEAVNRFKLHPTSISCLFKVCEHLLLRWMGIWIHTHPLMVANLSPDLRELAETLGDGDGSLQTFRYTMVEAVASFKHHPPSLFYM